MRKLAVLGGAAAAVAMTVPACDQATKHPKELGDCANGGGAVCNPISGGGGGSPGVGPSAGVDVATACLGDQNIYIIGGDGDVHFGPPLTIKGGAGWYISAGQAVAGLPAFISVNAGIDWTANFSTVSLGAPLSPGTYMDVQRAEFTDPGHAGLDVYGGGVGCNTVTGQFTVLDMTAIPGNDAGAPPYLLSFTATYEQHCDGDPQHSNIGCVHVSMPAPEAGTADATTE
jgi:hypothetical protein